MGHFSNVSLKLVYLVIYKYYDLFLFVIVCLNHLYLNNLYALTIFSYRLSYTTGPARRVFEISGCRMPMEQGYCCTVASATVQQQTWHQLISLVSRSVEVRQHRGCMFVVVILFCLWWWLLACVVILYCLWWRCWTFFCLSKMLHLNVFFLTYMT